VLKHWAIPSKVPRPLPRLPLCDCHAKPPNTASTPATEARHPFPTHWPCNGRKSPVASSGARRSLHLVKATIASLLLPALIVGCGHQPTHQPTAFTPPWRVVSSGVAALVDQHAERSAFETFRESSIPVERLRTFAAVERITANRQYSAAERAEQREWFRSASSVWHYTFECQYSGILFTDAFGRVLHAILQG